MRNCTFNNIIIKETRTGINLISAYSERAQHGVTIENVHFSNFLMDAMAPLNILLGRHAKPPAAIRNISFSHFRIIGEGGCYIGGNEGHPLEGVTLHEVDLRLTGGDVDADFAAKVPLPVGANRVPAGLWVRHVDGLRVTGLAVRWEAVSGPWQHAAVLEDCRHVRWNGVDAAPPPTAPDNETVRCIGVQYIASEGNVS